MSDQLHIAQNAAYRFTYLWYVFKYWLCKDHLWTGDFETIIIVYLFIHLFVCLFKLLYRFLGGILEEFYF